MWSDSSVKRQISSIKSRCKTQDEYKQQCYTLARLCLKGGLNNDALIHLRDYVSIKPNDYRAHKLMGDIYSNINQREISLACYKKCIQLKPNQVDVLNKVASIYCGMPDTNIEDLEEMVARLQSINPKDPLIDKLKDSIIIKGGVVKGDDNMVSISDSNSSKISTIKYLLTTNKIEEAYDVCQRVYRHSNWNDLIDQSHHLILAVYEKYLSSLKQSGVTIERVLAVELRLMEILCISCDIELRNICHSGYYNTSSSLILLIKKLDCCLHDVSQCLSSVGSLSSPLIENKFNELIGQVYYQISQCLFACHSTNYDYWQLGVVCGLCSLLQPVINESSGNYLSQVDRSDFNYWLQRSQSRHTVLASQIKLISLQDGPHSISKAVETFSSLSSKQAAIKMIFTDTLSKSTNNLTKSFIATDNSLMDPSLITLSQSIELYANNLYFISCYGCDLSAIVWLCTIYKALDTDIPYNEWVSCLFPSLPLSPSIETIRKNVPSSFCKCDVETLLIIAVHHCHKLMKITKTTPPSSIISGCVVWPQIKVPEELYKMWKNIQQYDNDVGVIDGIAQQKALSVTLQHVRACNPVALSNDELITLARHFKQRASDNSIPIEDVKILSEWSCHYWKVILDLSSKIHVPSNRIVTAKRLSTEKATRGRSPLVIKDLFSTHLDKDSDIDNNIVNEATMHIASHFALCPGEEDKALVLYDQLDTYQAAYNASQIYLRLSEGIEPVFRLRFLEKALQAIKIATKRAKEIGGNEKVMGILERQQDNLRELVGDYKSTSSFVSKTTPSQKFGSSFHQSSLMASTPTSNPHEIDKDLKIASMEKKLKHLEDEIIEMKSLQKPSPVKGHISPGNRSFTQTGSPSQIPYSPQVVYSNNFQSQMNPGQLSFQGSPNLRMQSMTPEQLAYQARMYTSPGRFSTPYSATFPPGMMGNVQGTPPGMMGYVRATQPGMMNNVQGTPSGMMGYVQGTSPSMMGHVRTTQPRMMGNVQGATPGMMGYVQATQPRMIQGTPPGMMGYIQATQPGMMSDVQGTPLRMMGSVQGATPRMMGNVQATQPGMMGSVQGATPRMMGNVQGTLPGMSGATPSPHLTQNIDMSPGVQYGSNTTPLIRSTVPVQTPPRTYLPSVLPQYGSVPLVRNPAPVSTIRPVGPMFNDIKFVPHTQTTPSIAAGVAFTTIASSRPVMSTQVTSISTNLLGNAPPLDNAFVSQQQPLFQFGASLETSKFTFSSQSTPSFTPLQSSDLSPPSAKQPAARISSINRTADTTRPQQYPFTLPPAPGAPLLATPLSSQEAVVTSSIGGSYKPFDSSNVPGYKPLTTITTTNTPMLSTSQPFTGLSFTATNISTSSVASVASTNTFRLSTNFTSTSTPSMPTTSSTVPSEYPSFNLASLLKTTSSLAPNTTATMTTSTATFSFVKPNTSISSFPSFQPVSLPSLSSPLTVLTTQASSVSPPFSPNASHDAVQSPDVSFEFQPVVSLPEVVQTKSGEEEEKELFSSRAKLYRYDKSQWKERGTGTIKILKNETTLKARIVMRRDQILKICCNHAITPVMQLQAYGATGDTWLWFTPCDYADGISKPEKFVVKFHKQPNVAKKFEEVFNKSKSPSSIVTQTDTCTPSQIHENDNSDSEQRDSTILTDSKMSTNWECGGCYISNKQSDTKCIACQALKPGATVSKTDIPSPSLGASGGLLLAGLNASNWECDGCYIQNKQSDVKCVACQALKPGTPSLGGIGGSSAVGTGITLGLAGGMNIGGLKLGSQSTTLTAGFKLDVPSGGGFRLGSLGAGLKLGSSDSSGGINPGGLKFGSSDSSGGINPGGLKFGSSGASLLGGSSSSTVSSQPFGGGIKIDLPQNVNSEQEKLEDNDNEEEESDESDLVSEEEPVESDIDGESGESDGESNGEYVEEPSAIEPPETMIPASNQFNTTNVSVTQPAVTIVSSVSQPTNTTRSVPPLTSQPAVTIVSSVSKPTSTTSVPLTSQPAVTSTVQFSFAKPSFSISSTSPLLASSPSTNTQSKTTTATNTLLFPISSSSTVAPSFADLSQGFQFNPTIIKSNWTDSDNSDEDSVAETSFDDIKVTPLVSLPKVTVSTGEENEQLLFNNCAKLHRMVNGEWKERGSGEVKILRNNTSNAGRIIMRRDQTFKICCNHNLYPYMELKPHGDKGRNWVWHTVGDLSEDSQQEETLLVRFQSVEVSLNFKECFEKMTSDKSIINSDKKLQTTPTVSLEDDDDDVVFVKEELPSDELVSKAESLMLPKSFYNYLNKPPCPGCIGCLEEHEIIRDDDQGILVQHPITNETTPKHTETTPTQTHDTNIPFAKASTGLLSFTDLLPTTAKESVFTQKDSSFSFTGAGRQLFQSPQGGGANNGDYNPEEETNVHFKPLVTLPKTYSYQTEEEDKNVLFESRGKIFRFDGKSGEWKERGVGNIRLLEYPKSEKYRILMRRDQIYKICCNHYLTPDMVISHHLGNEKALTWVTLNDFTEETARPEKFALKFGKAETAKLFKERFANCVNKLANTQSPTKDVDQSVISDDTSDKSHEDQTVAEKDENSEGDETSEGEETSATVTEKGDGDGDRDVVGDQTGDASDGSHLLNDDKLEQRSLDVNNIDPLSQNGDSSNMIKDNPVDESQLDPSSDAMKDDPQQPPQDSSTQQDNVDNLSQSSMPGLVDSTPDSSQEQ